jgi:hypothetical protein
MKLLVVVVLTFIITLSGGFLTEYFRQSISYSWAVGVGDEFVYEVSVTGNTTTPTQTLPPLYEPMNNTRIIVEITSLPNLTLMYYAHVFVQEVIEHLKTVSRFEDGSAIPVAYYNEINHHASFCILPIGAWGHLDSLFLDQFNGQSEIYTAKGDVDSFIVGYWSNGTNSRREWQGTIDLETGVPTVITFSLWSRGQPWIYYNRVVMTLVN